MKRYVVAYDSGDGSSWDSVASSVLVTQAAAATGSATAAKASASGTTYSSDPVLALQPPFAFSLVGQLFAQVVNFTMICVLLLHLVFTARYHWPLSRLNFCLQMAAAVSGLVAVVVILSLVLIQTRSRSKEWPFMFDYIATSVPSSHWDDAQLSGFFLLQGFLTIFTHATHIQFLTLLFPSTLEKRLILALLLPLALLAAGLVFCQLINTPEVSDLLDAIRTTANSTLTLLYTLGLLLWSTLLNRKRAWRTDGGTSMFGAMALTLATVGTALNYFEIHEDRLQWLPYIVFTILLWQSWSGFWWWVGSGMYAGEVEDRRVREERKRKREERKRAKRNRLPPLNETLVHRLGRRVGIASGVEPRIDSEASSVAQRRRSSRTTDVQEAIELRPLGTGVTIERDSSDTSRDSNQSIFMRIIRRLPGAGLVVASLSDAHDRAMRRRAEDQIQQRAQQPAASPWGANEADVQHSRTPRRPSTLARHETIESMLGDRRGMGEEAWEDAGQPSGEPATPAHTDGEGMGRDSLWWRGPIRRARLREVDRFD